MKLSEIHDKNFEQLSAGIDIEKEHIATYTTIRQIVKYGAEFPSAIQFFKMIAADHIKENPEYYTKLKKAGL
jgi:hypothetical protein